MLRGMYVAASGMLSAAARHEVNSVNLANLQTPGYKARQVALGTFFEYMMRANAAHGGSPVGPVASGPAVAASVADMRQGSLQQTQRPLDLAVQGPGFFMIQTGDGVAYTRAGEMRLNDDGLLVTAEGYPVWTDAGFIRLPHDRVTITPQGAVIVDGNTVARIRLVRFAEPERLTRADGGYFLANAWSGAPQDDDESLIVQGMLETANVETDAAMVDMLHALRVYEASQQALRVQDALLGLAANDLARF